jgi:hypothetical protein
MSPVRYKLGFHNPKDGILHSHRRENLKSDNKTESPICATYGVARSHSPVRVTFLSVMLMTSETRPPETMDTNNEGDRGAADTEGKRGRE